MDGLTKDMVSLFKGKIPDILVWAILFVVALVVLQKNDEIQDLKIVEAKTYIQAVSEECNANKNDVLIELRNIKKIINENETKEQEHYEDIIQRLSRIEK